MMTLWLSIFSGMLLVIILLWLMIYYSEDKVEQRELRKDKLDLEEAYKRLAKIEKQHKENLAREIKELQKKEDFEKGCG
jgi:predicted Holliday junction resolvase-like endonuclease